MLKVARGLFQMLQVLQGAKSDVKSETGVKIQKLKIEQEAK